MLWFWPNRKTDEEDKEDEELDESDEDDEVIEYELSEKLEMITNYMRTTYCFCHWCGTKYEDIDDMEGGCPGVTKDDH